MSEKCWKTCVLLSREALLLPVLLNQTTTINENHSLVSIKRLNKNLLINIDWLSIQIDNHSPMRLNFIDFYWLLFIINNWLCNSKNPERHSVLKPWLNLVANTTTLLCQGHPMDLFLKIAVLQAHFCWLGDVEEIIVLGRKVLLGKR